MSEWEHVELTYPDPHLARSFEAILDTAEQTARYMAYQDLGDRGSSLSAQAWAHSMLAQRHQAEACREAGQGDDADREQEWLYWLAIDRHLHATLHHATEGLGFADHVQSFELANLRCARVSAAAQLRMLDEALDASEALPPDDPCTIAALVQLGHALDREDMFGSAMDVFMRARDLASEHGRNHDALCGVFLGLASLDDQSLRDDLRCDPEPAPELESHACTRRSPDDGTCRWNEYVRYRMIWTALRGAAIDHDEAAGLLRELADEISAKSLAGADWYRIMIEHDLHELEAALDPASE